MATNNSTSSRGKTVPRGDPQPNSGAPVGAGAIGVANAARRLSEKRASVCGFEYRGPRPRQVSAGVLAEEVKRLAEEAAGTHDVALDVAAAERADRAAAEKARYDASAAVARNVPPEFWCMLEGPGKGLSAATYTRQELPQQLLPHKMAHVRFLGYFEAEPDHRLALHKETKLPGRFYSDMRFEVAVFALGVFGVELPVPPRVSIITIPYQVFALLQLRRYGNCPDVELIYRRVSDMVAWHVSYAYEEMPVLPRNVYLCDVVLTALLCLDGADASPIGWQEMWSRPARLLLEQQVFKFAKLDRPTVQGEFFQGYHLRMDEVILPGGAATATAALRLVGNGIQRGYGLKIRPLVDAVERSWRQCRLLSVGLVQGLTPTFPDPFSPGNAFLAFVKRIAGVRPKSTTVARDVLGDAVEECLRRLVFSEEAVEVALKPGALEAAARKHAHAVKFSPAQVDEFVAYADEVSAGLRPTGDLSHSIAVLKMALADKQSAFFKQEVIDALKVKPPRFIICASVRLRAVSWVVFYLVEHLLESTPFLRGHLVKGMTVAEQQTRLWECFANRPVLETDFKNMEANMNRPMLETVEDRFYRHAATRIPGLSQLLAPLLEYYSTEVKDVSMNVSRRKWLGMVLMPMRLSGEPQTSIGNALANMTCIVSALATIHGMTPKAWLDHDYPFLCEGDDGLFATPALLTPKLATEFVRFTTDLSLTVNPEAHMDYTAAHFCGNTIISTTDTARVQISRNPIALLTKMLTNFGRDAADTCRQDKALLVSRAMSMLTLFPDFPMVSAYCRKVLSVFRVEAEKVREEVAQRLSVPLDDAAETIVGLSLGARELLGRVAYEGVERVRSFLEYRNVLPEVPVPDAFRRNVAELYSIPQALQRQFEESLRSGWGTIDRSLTMTKAAARMAAREYSDSRTDAREAIDRLTSNFAVQLVTRASGLMLPSANTLLNLASGVFAILLATSLVLTLLGSLTFPFVALPLLFVYGPVTWVLVPLGIWSLVFICCLWAAALGVSPRPLLRVLTIACVGIWFYYCYKVVRTAWPYRRRWLWVVPSFIPDLIGRVVELPRPAAVPAAGVDQAELSSWARLMTAGSNFFGGASPVGDGVE